MKSLYTPYAITVSDFASGPPASPSSGDIWVATNADSLADGIRWQFQYNAGSSSAYKWEFIGGPPVQVFSPTGNGWASGGNYNDVGAYYTTIRSGDWSIFTHLSSDNTTGVATHFYFGVADNSTTTVNRVLDEVYSPLSGTLFNLTGRDRLNNVTAGHVIYTNGATSAGSGSAAVSYAQMALTPIRVA